MELKTETEKINALEEAEFFGVVYVVEDNHAKGYCNSSKFSESYTKTLYIEFDIASGVGIHDGCYWLSKGVFNAENNDTWSFIPINVQYVKAKNVKLSSLKNMITI